MIRGARKQAKISPLFLVSILLIIGLFFSAKWFLAHRRAAQAVQAEEVLEPVSNVLSAKSPLQKEAYDADHLVQDGDVLSDIFAGHEVPYQEIFALQGVESDVFRFTNVQPGKTVYFSLNPEGSDFRLREVAYQPDSTRIVKASQNSTGWIIEELPIVYGVEEAHRTGTIEDSLYASALRQGVDERAILSFVDAFAWDFDFALNTRSGDTYKMIYEEKYLDGELVTTGRVLAAQYSNQGEIYQGYYFTDGEIHGYYDEDGNSLQKAFLKAPVNFRYITSGFTTARYHPIFGKVMPHNGIDYAAPYGAPIVAVADGVVTAMGWEGAYGNRVRVSHGEKYGTQYGHMSAYVSGMKIGDHVTQGQVIGYVGSTGASTGNHVHFSMTVYGDYVDPATVDVPSGEPIPEEHLDRYKELVAKRKAELESM